MSGIEETSYRTGHDITDPDVDHPRRGGAAERLGGPSEADEPRAATDSSAETGDPADPADSAARARSSDAGQANLIPPDRAESYRARWNDLKGEFVDEPRRAVRGANALVGEVLDELEDLFRRQREEIERDLDSDDASTEDLRQALSNYRSFFDRLLSF